jgi:hemerythrin-like domain-containing protein
MMGDRDSRRAFLWAAGAGTLAATAACRREPSAEAAPPSTGNPLGLQTNANSRAGAGQPKGEDVGAVEDLMREHGVIRRTLVVYRESAARLRANPAAVPPDALTKAARLLRQFGEDYHEKQLEEAHIFPALRRDGGPVAALVAVLAAQHERGREITDYVTAVTQKAVLKSTAEPLARALEAFARMYEEHAAQEDTVVFPTWKKVLSPRQLDEMGDLFEDIERKTFGKDGFDDAVNQVSEIEKALGLDLGSMTAPPPPPSRFW